MAVITHYFESIQNGIRKEIYTNMKPEWALILRNIIYLESVNDAS